MNVPKLRFPEFRDAGEWEEKPLGNKTIKVGSGITPNGGEKNYKSKGRPFIRSQNIGWGYLLLDDVVFIDDITHSTFSATEINEEDVFLNITGASIGRSAVADYRVKAGNVNQHVCIIRTKQSELNPYYLNQYLLSQYGQKQIDSFQAGGNRQGLNFAQVRSFSLPLPLVEEQQKIADCLSSIASRISAETQKLHTLKLHKKGLMQQLFPAEGETLPKLRFPEFRDAGEWEEQSIQDLIDKKVIIGHLDGNHGALYPRAEEFSKEGVPYISANDFITGYIDFDRCKYLSVQRALQFRKGVAKDGDILFAHNATVGPVTKLSTDLRFVVLSTTATYFRCNHKYLINDFLKFALSSPSFVEQYTRVMSQSTRNQVPITTQRKFNLQIPSLPEQQKIADCLSSIDELITAQTQKIDTLKVHKKGLMQQLFPSVNGEE
jgi:type I restriction enzyme, S subunit